MHLILRIKPYFWLVLSITILLSISLAQAQSLASPTNLRARDVSHDSITVGWKTVRGAASYEVWLKGAGWTAASKKRKHTFQGLQPNRIYTIRVRAVDDQGNAGANSKRIKVSTKNIGQTIQSPPTQVDNLRATQTTHKSVSLAWDAVPGAVDYAITVNLIGGAGYDRNYPPYQVAAANVGNVASYTFNSLEASLRYTVGVAALDSVGSAIVASEITVTTKKLPVPQNVRLVSANATSIRIAWDAAPDAQEYRIFYGAAGGKKDGVEWTSNTSLTVTNLRAGAAYEFMIGSLRSSQFDYLQHMSYAKFTASTSAS